MNFKLFCKLTVLFAIITLLPMTLYGNNYFRFNSDIDGEDFTYENLYLSYSFKYGITPRITLRLKAKKLASEPGYYPLGYLYDSDYGLYERGSYSLDVRGLFDFERIIIGNYKLKFGQGILLGGSGLQYIDNPGYQLSRVRAGVKPGFSYSKGSMLEGLVVKYSGNGYVLIPYLSINRFDCTAGESSYYKYNDNDSDGISNDEDDDDFTGAGKNFPDTYSCKNRLMDAVNDETVYSSDSYRERRNKLTEYIIGVDISRSGQDYIYGFGAYYSFFNRLVDPYYNFDEGEGDKTSYYFRGKNYLASNFYFKRRGTITFFAEAAGTVYRGISYYDEFNSKLNIALGISSGINFDVEDNKLFLWTLYLPPNLVNPHGSEFPWGRNNILSAIAGMDLGGDGRSLLHWLEFYHEIYSIDGPGRLEETSISYRIKFMPANFFTVKQTFRAIKNYYSYPGEITYKTATKMTYKHRISTGLVLTTSGEFRSGKAHSSGLKTGIGAGERINYTRSWGQLKGSVFLYTTSRSVLASLYPYELSIYTRSFFPSSINGTGALFSFAYIRDFSNLITSGIKVRYNASLSKRDRLSIYLTTEYNF